MAVVGVTKASEADARKFQLELGATYPILADAGVNFSNYKVSSIPASFLVDGEGQVLAQGLDEIEDELTRTTSRSGWIADACRMRLKETHPQSIETRTLMAMLHARCEFDETLRTILLDRINGLREV